MVYLQFSNMKGDVVFEIPFVDKACANKEVAHFHGALNAGHNSAIMIESDDPYNSNRYMVPLQPMFIQISYTAKRFVQ